ncbi:YecA family protein [Evansella halocellulosilytica]|uniref:YecA family protein n=1 Tax=Evansella halocellulosilytica TaxID=2011013 RepID=UPI000BB75954|nr:SEC-C metal-binding domain-containing protein [Evansella halocellulosilytica]
MATIGRNEACPCGSGKKYKKCCLNKQNKVGNLSPQDSKDFQELLPRIFDFSKSYDETLQPVYEQYSNTFRRLQKPDSKALSQLLFHWIVFNDEGVADGQAVLKRFITEHYDRYSNGFQHILNEWKQLQPRLIFVKKKEHGKAVLKDVLEGSAIFPESTGVVEQLHEGDLVVGFVYPTPTGPVIGSDVVVLPKRLEAAFMGEWTKLYEGFNDEKLAPQPFFTRNFPSILGILAMISLKKVNDSEANELAASAANVWTQLQSAVRLADYSYDIIIEAREIWAKYVAEKRPRIQKPEVFAAALEYWMTKQPSQWTTLSQKAAAEKYNVSSATVSSRYKELQAI